MVVAKVLESKEQHYGYNALTSKFEDLVKAGVIDPTKVTRRNNSMAFLNELRLWRTLLVKKRSFRTKVETARSSRDDVGESSQSSHSYSPKRSKRSG